MRSFIALVVCCLPFVRADIVQCENGDRYNGTVLLVDQTNVKLTNEITGVLNIPRAKVSSIAFGSAKTPNVAVARVSTNTLSSSAPFQIDPKSVDQVQTQLLGDANPEATQMFQEMVRGLMSGKVGLGDIQNKAQGTLNQLKDLQKDLGDDDAAALLSSYASILQSFISQTPSKAPAQE